MNHVRCGVWPAQPKCLCVFFVYSFFVKHPWDGESEGSLSTQTIFVISRAIELTFFAHTNCRDHLSKFLEKIKKNGLVFRGQCGHR